MADKFDAMVKQLKELLPQSEHSVQVHTQPLKFLDCAEGLPLARCARKHSVIFAERMHL